MIPLTLYEQETIINYNEEQATAEIYTASKRVADLLERRGGLKPYKIDKAQGKAAGWYFKVSKTAIIVKPARHGIKVGGSRKINIFPSGDTLGAAVGEQNP